MISTPNKSVELHVWVRDLAARLAKDVLSYEKGTVRGADIEDLHRMRSRINRLRRAVSLLGEAGRLRAREEWGKELQWLAATLGPVRDLDVMIEQTKALSKKGPRRLAKAGVAFAVRSLARRRETERGALRKAFRSKEWKALRKRLDRLARKDARLWESARGVRAASAAAPASPVRLFAAVIAPCLAKFGERRRAALDDTSPRRLHRLRLAGKQVRYALEFFSPFLGKEGARHVAFLTRMQDCLGEIHDLESLDGQLKSLRLSLLLSPKRKDAPRLPGVLRLIQMGRKRRVALHREFETLWPGLHPPGGVIEQIENLAAKA